MYFHGHLEHGAVNIVSLMSVLPVKDSNGRPSGSALKCLQAVPAYFLLCRAAVMLFVHGLLLRMPLPNTELRVL